LFMRDVDVYAIVGILLVLVTAQPKKG